MWWPIIVQRVQVHVLRPSTEIHRAQPPIHIVAIPTMPQALDQRIIFFRWSTS